MPDKDIARIEGAVIGVTVGITMVGGFQADHEPLWLLSRAAYSLPDLVPRHYDVETAGLVPGAVRMSLMIRASAA